MIFSSPHPPVAIPEIDVARFVLEGAKARGDKPALIDGSSGRALTHAEFATQVERTAAGLHARGFRKGEVFAIVLPNLPEYAVAFHGIALAGGISTTMNPLYTADELAFQLQNSGTRYLLTIPELLDKCAEAARRVGLEEIFVLGEAAGAIPFAALAGSDGAVPDVVIDPAEDLATLPYSSGTTGFPKGVMLTHRNIVANLCQVTSVHPTSERDVLIGVLPFFHIYGMTVIMNVGLLRGATVVTMPRFDLEQFLQLVQDRRVTRAHVVPPIMLALAKHPIVDRYDASSLDVVMSGAAPLGPELAERSARRLGCTVIQGYGLTETSPALVITPEDRSMSHPRGSIGVPIPNTEARVLNVEDGRELGPLETGEICVRGPQVMKGYLNNPEATAATLDIDGWLHTGDLGYVDGGGYVFVVDRLKELIKYKGFPVPPAELEAVLLSHPSVSDAAVVPAPDAEAGEVPKAFVVASGDITDEELMAYVAERVAPHKQIREVEFIDEVPKSPSGKILRRVLVDRERAAAARSRTAPTRSS